MKASNGDRVLMKKTAIIIILACALVVCVGVIIYQDLQMGELTGKIAELQAPQLHVIRIEWKSSPEVGLYVSAVIFNSGTEAAHNVTWTVNAYSENGTLLTSEVMKLGDIAGRDHVFCSYECLKYFEEVYIVIPTVSFG